MIKQSKNNAAQVKAKREQERKEGSSINSEKRRMARLIIKKEYQ